MLENSVFIYSLLAIYFCTVNSAKILVVVPSPSISHQVVFRPLIQGLIKRGHDITFITTDPMYSRDDLPNNLSEIDVHDLSYGIWNKILLSKARKQDTQNNHLLVMEHVFRVLSLIFGEQLKLKSVQEFITQKKVKFDLLIVEECVTPALIFSHIFKAPLIQMSSFGAVPANLEVIGASTHPLLYPTHYHTRLYNLTYFEKITELTNHFAFDKMFEKQEIEDNKMLQSIFGVDVPPLSHLKNNIHMLFLNIHPIWIHNPPVPPNVIFTWGIHKISEKSLPEDLQAYLDSSTNGAIYVSFGTNVKPSTIGPENLNILVKVFSQLPHKILWKWDLDEIPGLSDNIKISKWFPQVDVLRHPNLKLFITQGGLQSTDEAINAGVPLIGFPMFADQMYNTAKYEHFQIGKQLDFRYFTEDTLKSAIANIFTNYESYRKNIIKLRTQMQDQPKPPLENAIWWVEYVLRHGGAKHLRSPAANMPWTKYYELKLVLLLLSGVIVFGTFLIIIIYFCYKYIIRHLNYLRIKMHR